MTLWWYEDVDGKILSISKYENCDMMFRILRGNCLEAVAWITADEIKKGNIL